MRDEQEKPEKRNRRDWDAYAAVIASFVGLLALAVSAYTAYLQQKTLKAEVWPRLSVGASNMLLRLYASNTGMGPARVKGVRVTMAGKVVKNWGEVARGTGGTGNEIIYSQINGRVLPPGENLEIAQPRQDDASKELFRKLVNGNPGQFHILVCFCSVLDECWTDSYGYTMNDGKRDDDDEEEDDDDDDPLPRCAIPRPEQFDN